jgi:hypothetical protein
MLAADSLSQPGHDRYGHRAQVRHVVRLGAAILTALAFGAATPAGAATCQAEAGLRVDPHWRNARCHSCLVNRIHVGPGASLRWNGAAVDLVTLRQYLDITANMDPLPFAELVIRRNTDCDLIARVRATIEASLPCETPHCGFALVEPAPLVRRRRH